MVDTVDSKSAAGNGVRVQVPPGVQGKGTGTPVPLLFLWKKFKCHALRGLYAGSDGER